jgi:hypothetical protein
MDKNYKSTKKTHKEEEQSSPLVQNSINKTVTVGRPDLKSAYQNEFKKVISFLPP